LIQMRSMRIALNYFLFKIKAVESDQWYCSEESQTPRHILMQCPLYADLRKTFLDKIRITDLGDSTDYDAIVLHWLVVSLPCGGSGSISTCRNCPRRPV
jgi:hypothetical protein